MPVPGRPYTSRDKFPVLFYIAAMKSLLSEMEKLATSRYVSPYFKAIIYAGLEDKERAMECLEQALSQRSASLVNLRADPIWDNLRPEPRFAALLRKMGLEK
jgi:hypothetical protein